MLEEGGSVAQSEVHYCGVIGSKACFYCGLIPIFWVDADVIISPTNIHLGEECLSLERFHGLPNTGDWVVIPLHPLVDLLVIKNWSEFVPTFLLRDEVTGACYRRLFLH